MIGYEFDDGGREAAGYRGSARDCAARALAIASGADYRDCYAALAEANARYEANGRRSARNGIDRRASDRVKKAFGFTKVKLPKGPRPTYTEAYERYGDCMVTTTRHICAIIDGTLRDTFDGRTYHWVDDLEGVDEWRERKAMSVWVKA